MNFRLLQMVCFIKTLDNLCTTSFCLISLHWTEKKTYYLTTDRSKVLLIDVNFLKTRTVALDI